MSTNCYGRIPRERMFEQNERLTTKHIKTLTFLQDIGQENKELKKKLKVLEVSECISRMQFATFPFGAQRKMGYFEESDQLIFQTNSEAKKTLYTLDPTYNEQFYAKKQNIFIAGCSL